MKLSVLKPSFLAVGLCAAVLNVPAQDHGHLRIGAPNTAQNTPLYFYNGSDFAKASSYVKTLIHTNAGRFAGYYQGNITLTVQAATSAYSGPEADPPALGSLVRATILSIQGPPGGTFGFWESNAVSPTLSIPAGQTNGVPFIVSQTSGLPGADPFGHIHGRRFTATRPGIYTATFQAHDSSTNGVGGGPIHAYSPTLEVVFQAGVCIASVEPDYEDGHVHVRFGATAGRIWQVEYTTLLGPGANWLPAGHPVPGNDYFLDRIHDLPPGAQRFYRVVGTLPPP